MVKLVRLKKGAEKILGIDGKLTIYNKWIYDDGGADTGDEVIIETFDRKSIGVGIYDGVGAVGVRILSLTRIEPLADIIKRRILEAYKYRGTLGWDSFRLINSEGDYIPGLIIDVYKDTAVIQSGSAGLDQYLNYIGDILVKMGIASRIYVRNDQRSRREAGLDIWRGWLHGSGDTLITIREGDAKFIVDIEKGQKTGFFLDQRMNRLEARLYSPGRRILDLYSYTGGFGIQALLSGGSKATFVEEDKYAIEILMENLKMNRLLDKADVYQGRVEEFLNENSSRFNLIFSDPPAFITSRRGIEAGLNKYRWLFKSIIETSEKGGIIFYSSCSYFLKADKFRRLIRDVVKDLGIKISILGRIRGVSPDHIMRPPDNELNYLKAIYLLLR